MEVCLLVDAFSAVAQLLPPHASVNDVLEKGPLHSVNLPSGWTLHWSSSSYQLSEVNSVATSLAKQLIKGDACLVHPNCQQHMLDDLLHSRSWRMAQPCQPSVRRSTTGSGIDSSHMQHNPACHPATSPSLSCTPVLKRTRSLQRIAAANNARHRILSGMAAAAAAASLEGSSLSVTLPQQHDSWYNSSGSRHQHGMLHKRALKTASRGLPPAHAGSCTPARDTNGAGSGSARMLDQLPLVPLHGHQRQQHHQQQHTHAAREVIPLHLHNNSNKHRVGSCSMHQPPAAAAVTGVCLSSHSGSCRQLCSPSLPSCCSSSSGLPSGAAAGAICTGSAAAAVFAPEQLHRGMQDQEHVDADVQMTDADKAQRVEAAAAVAATALPAWAELLDGVLGRIAGCLGSTAAAVLPMCSACRAWRRAVLHDDQLLLGLRFSLNVSRPFKLAAARHYHRHATARQQHPALLLRACQLGNVSALVARARLLDAAGCAEEGMRCWKRSAKAGHAEGQLVYGLGLYRGIAGLQEDAQDAHMWLARALKQVQQSEAATSASSAAAAACSAAAATGAQPAAAATGAQPAAAPTTTTTTTADTLLADAGGTTTATSSSNDSNDSSGVTPASELAVLRQRVLAHAGLVLGYLAFDGEGSLRVDKQEATRYFRLAAAAGCKEAEEVLGWVYNTGQYGAL